MYLKKKKEVDLILTIVFRKIIVPGKIIDSGKIIVPGKIEEEMYSEVIEEVIVSKEIENIQIIDHLS